MNNVSAMPEEIVFLPCVVVAEILQFHFWVSENFASPIFFKAL